MQRSDGFTTKFVNVGMTSVESGSALANRLVRLGELSADVFAKESIGHSLQNFYSWERK